MSHALMEEAHQLQRIAELEEQRIILKQEIDSTFAVPQHKIEHYKNILKELIDLYLQEDRILGTQQQTGFKLKREAVKNELDRVVNVLEPHLENERLSALRSNISELQSNMQSTIDQNKAISTQIDNLSNTIEQIQPVPVAVDYVPPQKQKRSTSNYIRAAQATGIAAIAAAIVTGGIVLYKKLFSNKKTISTNQIKQ